MLKAITAPAIEPVTVEEARLALRQDIHDDDTLVAGLISAARSYAENVLRRALITQTWELVLDDWPSGNTIALPRPPLQSVTSLKYTDEDAVEHTLASASYTVDTDSVPGRLVLKDDYAWPTDDLREAAAIRVRYVAGYGTEATDVPEMIRLAMRIFVGQLYENREKPDTAVADTLLWPYRVF